MNERCRAKTKSGRSCKALVVKNGLCALHGDPERAAELGRRSGRARRYVVASEEPELVLPAPRTAEDVRDVVGQAISDVRARRLDPRVATCIAYMANVLLKAVQQGDHEARLQALESVLESRASQEG